MVAVSSVGGGWGGSGTGGPLAISVEDWLKAMRRCLGCLHCNQHHRAIWRLCRIHVVGDVLDVIPERELAMTR